MPLPSVTKTLPGRKPLEGLTSPVYEHLDDRAFLSAFRSIPGAGALVAWSLDHHARLQNLQMLGNGLQVTRTSLPTLDRLYRDAATALCIEKVPPLYSVTGPPNAYTTGADQPMVVVTTEAVDLLTDDELRFVLGHELGHCQAGHTVYHSLGQVLRYGAEEISRVSLGLGGALASATLGPTLYAWHRRSEFTADRAGLLACQDPTVARTAMAKLAGVPSRLADEADPDALLEQADAYADESGGSLVCRLLELRDNLAMTHPYWVLRAVELQQWVDDGFYDDVMLASPDDLERMAAWMSDDPAVQTLATAACRATAHWAGARFHEPPAHAGRLIRRMVYAGETPVDSPLAAVHRLELHLEKVSPVEVIASVKALFVNGGRARGATIPVAFNGAWEHLPGMLREEFIRGGGDRISRVLYTTSADT
jgi:Zn-dependent protease with chaperone function